MISKINKKNEVSNLQTKIVVATVDEALCEGVRHLRNLIYKQTN